MHHIRPSPPLARDQEWAAKQGLAGVFLFDSTGFDATVYDAITAGLCEYFREPLSLLLEPGWPKDRRADHETALLCLPQTPGKPAEPRLF